MVHIAQTEEEDMPCLRESSHQTSRRKRFFHRLSLRVTKSELVETEDEVQLRPLTERPSSKKKHVIKARRSLSGSKGKKFSRGHVASVRGKSLPTEDLDTTAHDIDRRPSVGAVEINAPPRSRPKRKAAGTVGRRGALQVGHATAAVEESHGPVGNVP